MNQKTEQKDIDVHSQSSQALAKKVLAKLSNFKNLPFRYQNNNQFISHLIEKNGLILEHLSFSYQNNENFVYDCIRQNPQALFFASQAIQQNESFLLKIVDLRAENYFLLNSSHQINELFIEKALRRKGVILQNMSDQVKDDEKFVSIAIHQNGLSLKYASEKFLNNLDYILEALKYSRGFEKEFIEFLPPYIRNMMPKNPTFDSVEKTLEKIYLNSVISSGKKKDNKIIKI